MTENIHVKHFVTFMKSRTNNNNPKPTTHSSIGVFHPSLMPHAAAFHISDDDLPEFYELYGNVLDAGGCAFPLSEMIPDTSFIAIDFDLKLPVPIDVSERNIAERAHVYNVNHTRRIVEIYHELLARHFEIEIGRLDAYVLEKEHPSLKPSKDGAILKDGFHILIPDVPISLNHRLWLYHKVLAKIKEERLLDDIGMINSYEDAFDTAPVKNALVMMFAMKNDAQSPYRIKRCYECVRNARNDALSDHGKEDECEDGVQVTSSVATRPTKRSVLLNQSACEQVKYFSLRKFLCPGSQEAAWALREHSVQEFAEWEAINIVRHHNTRTQPSDVVSDSVREAVHKLSNSKAAPLLARTAEASDELKTRIHSTLMMLPEEYAKDYEKWFRIMLMLQHTSITDSMFTIFDNFSERSPRYKGTSDVRKHWDTHVNAWYASIRNNTIPENPLTIRSLWYIAKRANPDKYRELWSADHADRIRQLDDKSDGAFANLVHNYIGEIVTYVSASSKSGTWWEFKSHRWRSSETARPINEWLGDSPDGTPGLGKILKDSLNAHASALESREDPKILETIRKKANAIHSQCNSITFINKIIAQCTYKFDSNGSMGIKYGRDNFMERLDAHKGLVGFNNGIYDLNLGVLRDGTPDDMVTVSVGYDYRDDFTLDHPLVREVTDFFESVQPNPATRDYLLLWMSSLLSGSTASQKFMIWTGDGSNGKSTTSELLTKVLGDYALTLSHTLLTRKKGDSSGPTPDLAKTYRKRLLILDEPEKDDRINTGVMKNLSAGNDKISARKLYGAPFEFYPHFKMLMLCNDLPFITSTEFATWRRIIAVGWDVEFVDAKDVRGTLEPHQRLKSDLSEKIATWREPLMWLLTKIYYPRFAENGLGSSPPEVQAKTDKYQQRCDIVREFVDRHLIIDRNAFDIKMKMQDLIRMFSDWIKEEFSGVCRISVLDFREYMSSRYRRQLMGTSKNIMFYGMRLRTPQDDEDDAAKALMDAQVTTTDECELKEDDAERARESDK